MTGRESERKQRKKNAREREREREREKREREREREERREREREREKRERARAREKEDCVVHFERRMMCSRTALCLTSLSLARLLALRLPDGSRLKKPSPYLWKIDDFLCLRTGGAHAPYTRGLTASCVRAQSRACFPCICTRMRAYTSFICTRIQAWAHEHPQTCAHVWCPYVHHTSTRSTLVHPQPCAHMRTRCAAT